MSHKIDKYFPFLGIDFLGKKHKLKEKDGNMGLCPNGKWKHFVSIKDNVLWEAKKVHYVGNNGVGSICGRNNRSCFLKITIDKNKVDCEFCLEKMKDYMYYCEIHGFIDAKDVTNDEKCDYCNCALANER